MNRISFLKRAAMLLLVAVPATSLWAQVSGGSGTAGDPYLISTSADLDELATKINVDHDANYVGKYYQLANDIEYSGTFAPIGTSETTGHGQQQTTTFYCVGQFDGAGHYISGITIDNNSSNNQGLFGVIGSGAIVKNLVLTNSYFDGKDNVGGIAGTNYGTIENCHVTTTVTIHASHIQGHDLKCIAHGGIAGLNGGTVTGCSSSAIISSANSTNKNQSFGGIVGQNGFENGHQNVYLGTVSDNFAIAVNLSSCGEGNYGIIIGQNKNGTVTTNYYNGCKLDDVIKESAFGVGKDKKDNNKIPVDLDGGAEHGYYAALVGEYIIATTQSDITTVIVPAHLEDNAIEKTTYHIYESGEISFELTHNRSEWITDFETNITPGTISNRILTLTDENEIVTAPWLVTVGENIANKTYNGAAQIPDVDIKDDATVLNELTDYDIVYEDDLSPDASPRYAGQYGFTITGTGNYYGTTKLLSFTIDQKDLTITADSDSKVYDGTALTKNSYTHTSLADGDEFVSVTVNGSQTSANSSDNVPSGAVIRNGSDIDVTGSYNITYLNGTLEVTKRPVTLTSATDSKEFDGNPLTNNTVTVSGDGWATGEGATFNVTGTITKVGTDNNTFTYALNDGTLASNYTITPVNGKLTIMQNTSEITVVPGSGSKTYDGTALTKTEQADFAVTGVPDGFTWTASADGTVTNVVPGQGEKAVNAVSEFKIFNSDDEDVTDQFSSIDLTATGTLNINKRAVTLTANNASGEYTGSAITYSTATDAVSPYYTVSDGSLANGQAITSISLTGEGVNVGNYDIEITEGSVAIGANTANYDISLVKGTLTISQNQSQIVVVPGSDSKEYDGTALTKTEHDDFTVTGVPDGFTWTAVADGTVTNVVPGEGEKSENAVSDFKIFLGEEDVTGQFSNIDVSATGTLTINKRAVTLTANNASGEYNGFVITYATATNAVSPYYTVSDGSLANGQAITSISLTGKGVTVGDYDIEITEGSVTIGANTANYDITLAKGTLTIFKNQNPLTVASESKDWNYDAGTHTYKVYKVTFGDEVIQGSEGQTRFTLNTGDIITITPDGKGATGVKNVSDSGDNSFTWTVYNEDCYTKGDNVVGTLTINPRTTNNGWMSLSEGGSYTDVAIDGDKLEDCTYDFGDGLTATNVTFSRKFTTEYATICLPFEVDITTANNNVGTFYQIDEISKNVVKVEEVIENLAANTPYIVKPNDYTGSVAATLSSENISFPLTAANDIEDTDGKWTFKGARAVTSFTDLADGHVVYFFASTDQKDDEDNIEIYAGDFVQIDNANAKAAPFRAYLEYTGDGNLSLSSSAAGRNTSASSLPRTLKVVILNGDGSTTQIGTISMSGEDTWFTIDGIQLESQPTEGGLYIRNGRAVMVK